MRMRKKKHLAERLANCTNVTKLISDDCNVLTAIEKKEYIDTAELFGNDNPVVLEIGCGKGKFACELAKRNPDINVIALEKCANVLWVYAVFLSIYSIVQLWVSSVSSAEEHKNSYAHLCFF